MLDAIGRKDHDSSIVRCQNLNRAPEWEQKAKIIDAKGEQNENRAEARDCLQKDCKNFDLELANKNSREMRPQRKLLFLLIFFIRSLLKEFSPKSRFPFLNI